MARLRDQVRRKMERWCQPFRTAAEAQAIQQRNACISRQRARVKHNKKILFCAYACVSNAQET